MEEGRSSAPARETMSTAELDNRGLLQLQQDTMSRQDNELEELERSVNSTKVRALPAPVPALYRHARCPQQGGSEVQKTRPSSRGCKSMAAA